MKRAFYDYLNGDADVAEEVHEAVLAIVKDKKQADGLTALVKEQSEY